FDLNAFLLDLFLSSRRRHTRSKRDWSSDVCSSDLQAVAQHGGSRPFTYKPVVGEKESMAAAADDLFDHMCAMRVGSTIAGVIQSRELSRADIANLQAILAEKAKPAPVDVQ